MKFNRVYSSLFTYEWSKQAEDIHMQVQEDTPCATYEKTGRPSYQSQKLPSAVPRFQRLQ